LNIEIKLRKQNVKYNIVLIPLFVFAVGLLGLTYSGILELKSGYSFGPANPEPFELGNVTGFFQDPFNEIIAPYEATLGDFTLVIAWAIIIGVLWIRVSNTMMVGVIGVALAALFTQGFSEDAQQIGYALLAAAVAVALFQILTVRINFPTN